MKTILITGATGSFGSALARHLLHTTEHKVRLLARNEGNIVNLQRELHSFSDRTTFIIADVRDMDRLIFAFDGVEEVYHAAALKQVPQSYTQVNEFIKTNILGTQNVCEAAIIADVGRVLLVSSDKSPNALNPYGSTKFLAEHIVVQANHAVVHGTLFAAVRGGNVWGSRGSVMELWSRPETESLDVYGSDTTRFHLPMPYWLQFCQRAMSGMRGGEIFIPNCKAWKLSDLAHAFNQHFHKPIRWLDPRPGDKTHETLISEYEAQHALKLEWGSVIQPAPEIREVWHYEAHKGTPHFVPMVSNGVRPMTIDELRTAIVRGG